MKKLTVLFLFCLFTQIIWAQNMGELIQHLNAFANGQANTLNKKTLEKYCKGFEAIPLLESYLRSENPKIQKEAVRLSIFIGSQHQKPYTRQLAVRQLLVVAINSATNGKRIAQIGSGLQKFQLKDFDEEALAKVSLIVKTKETQLTKWIELAGFLQLREALDEIRYTYQDDKHLRKKIGLALTRCGDQSKKENLLKNIKKLPVNDEFIFGIAPLLVYTRQKETTEVLFDIILSDQKNCEPSGPDVGGNIKCGYRVMEMIAPYVKGIPLEIGPSGDLKTKDYKKTLEDTREWILANRSNYELVTNIY